MKNEYIPFPSVIKKIIRHTEIEYTFRMSYSGEVKPGQFLRFPFRNSGRLPFPSAESARIPWI